MIWAAARTAVCLLLLGLTQSSYSQPTCAKNSEAPKNVAGWSYGSKGTIVYSLFKPLAYDKTKKYPLAMYLHSAGDIGNCNGIWQRPEPAQWSSSAQQAPHASFVVAPQCPAGDQWVNVDFGESDFDVDKVPISKALQSVMDVIAQVRDSFSIDSARIYVAGGSMGGFGAWYAIEKFPNVFSAVIPMSGSGDNTHASRLVNRGVWAVSFARDGAVASGGTRYMIESIRKAGGTPKYTERAGEEHIWDDAEHWAPGITDWLFAQRMPGSTAASQGTQPDRRLLRPTSKSSVLVGMDLAMSRGVRVGDCAGRVYSLRGDLLDPSRARSEVHGF